MLFDYLHLKYNNLATVYGNESTTQLHDTFFVGLYDIDIQVQYHSSLSKGPVCLNIPVYMLFFYVFGNFVFFINDGLGLVNVLITYL